MASQSSPNHASYDERRRRLNLPRPTYDPMSPSYPSYPPNPFEETKPGCNSVLPAINVQEDLETLDLSSTPRQGTSLPTLPRIAELPPRSSSLQYGELHRSLKHTAQSSLRHSIHVDDLPSSSEISPTSLSAPNPFSDIIPDNTSVIVELTMVQWQQNLWPILYTVGIQMYRARMANERRKRSGDLLSVQLPSVRQVMIHASELGWNLGWEGWKWT